MMLEKNRIHNMDCRELAKRLKPNSVDMIVTSPPYFNLRDYGHPGQIGLEGSPDEYVAAMVQVFAALRPALKDTGTLWLNIGDTYATNSGGPGNSFSRDIVGSKTKSARFRRPTTVGNGIKPKDLIGIPWMLAFALRADGWYLRQDIVWSKPNPMPESVTDRCTKSHEYIFLLSKSERYYFDNEAIKENAEPSSIKRQQRGVSDSHKNINGAPGQTPHSMSKAREHDINRPVNTKRNKRSVWQVATKPFGGAHFAVYPHELITPCILAGTSEAGNCKSCGAPWERILEAVITVGHTGQTGSAYGEQSTAGRLAKLRQAAREQGTEYTGEKKTVGWRPTCSCKENDPVPAVVCDPFMGSGTTASVAKILGRDYIGSELNPDYMTVNDARLHKELGLFNQ